MANRDDATTLVAGHLDHGAFESDPARRVAMRSVGRTFAGMAGVYRDLVEADEGNA